MPILAKLVYSLDDEVLIDACWAISYLSDGSNDKIQAVIEASIPRRLVELLMHSSTSVQTPALRSVGNIVTGDDVQTQVIINSGALPALLSLLSSTKDGIRKEACWAISNATSGGLQKPQQIRYLVSCGAIKPLCDLLACPDNKIVQVALDGLDNILKIGEMDKQSSNAGGEQEINRYALFIEEFHGMEKIHDCQNNANEEIYMKAYNMIEKYFSDEETAGDIGELAPTQGNETFGFGGPGQQQQQGQSGFNFANGADSMDM